MQYVAAEMQRDDYFRIKKIPLLIGGATTSRVHTAVKIAPHYEGPVVYVPDASRSVGVCSELLSDERAAAYIAELEADYEKVRAQHANKKQVPLSRSPRRAPTRRRSTGRPTRRRRRSSSAAACSRTRTWPSSPRYIDWGPFFQTWDLAGPYPGDPQRRDRRRVGAPRCLSDGQRMLQRVIEGRWLRANGVVGLWPATTVDDDDIEIYTDESRSDVLFTWRGLRLQTERPVVDGVKRPEPLPRRLHRAQGLGQARLHRPVRRHRRPRRREEGEAVRRRPRRLQRDHAEGARRPAGRGLRRAAAPARAHRPLGLRARRGARRRRA